MQVFSWTAPALDHSMDCVRAEDASFSQLDYEGHMPGQVHLFGLFRSDSFSFNPKPEGSSMFSHSLESQDLMELSSK